MFLQRFHNLESKIFIIFLPLTSVITFKSSLLLIIFKKYCYRLPISEINT
jgi:hypothetical protein